MRGRRDFGDSGVPETSQPERFNPVSTPAFRSQAPPLADAVPVVAAVLREAVLCWRCIVAKAGAPKEAVDSAVIRLRATATVLLKLGACDGCGRDTLLYGLA
jgi:hypothetical protein